MTLRLGTRGSPLARWQAEWIAARLGELPDAPDVQLVWITTTGDRMQRGPVEAIGPPGVFTKEIQRALQLGEVDIAVHSLKDLPTDPVPGLRLAAVPPRGPAGDVFVSSRYERFADLPPRAVVGTGSLRRRAQLLYARPDLLVQGIRGNVETRVRKVETGQCDAVILAEAGLTRLGMADHVRERLDFSLCMPAVGQGALAVEIREEDDRTAAWVELLNDPTTMAAVRAERAMLAALQGGCLAPIAAWGCLEHGALRLKGRVLDRDGRHCVEAEVQSDNESPESLGLRLASQLRDRGAAELIEASRQGE